MMYLFDYDPSKFTPEDIAKSLGLKMGGELNSCVWFCLKKQMVGYLIRKGLIIFKEGLVAKITETKERR